MEYHLISKQGFNFGLVFIYTTGYFPFDLGIMQRYFLKI